MAADVQDLSAQVMASHRDNAVEAAAAKKLSAEKVRQVRLTRAALVKDAIVSADL